MNWRPSGPTFGVTLRGMLVITTLLAVGVALVGVKVKRAREERDIAREIVRSGGRVQRQCYGMDVSAFPDRTWFERMLDLDLEARVVSASLVGPGVTDELLARLAGLSDLRHLRVHYTSATGAGLEALALLPNLTNIEISEPPVDGDGISALAALQQVKNLRIESGRPQNEETAVSWATTALTAASKMSELRQLSLHGPIFSDKSLQEFRGSLPIRSLDLVNCQVSNAGLESISQKILRLESLQIGSPPLDGAGIAHLQDCSSLTNLYVDNCPTEECVKQIAELRQLRSLQISFGPNLNDETLRALSRLENLVTLRVTSGGEFTDRGAKYLAGLTSLEHLNLHATRGRFTDYRPFTAGMNLKSLQLHPSAFSPAAIEELRAHISNVSVSVAQER